MGFLGACFNKDFRRFSRDPVAILLAVALPLVVGLLLHLGFGGDGRSPAAILLIADRDSSVAGRLLASALSQGPLGDRIMVENVSEVEGSKQLDRGRASGLLILPAGFGADLVARRPTTLTLVTNPSQRILPQMLGEIVGTLVDGANSLQLLLGRSLDLVTAPPPAGRATPSDSSIAGFSVAVNQIMERGARYLFPPAITVETIVFEEKVTPERGFADLFFPSLLFMGLLFASQNLSDDVWKERMQGTLRRTLTTPGRLTLFLAGKLLAIAAFITLVALAGLLAGRYLFAIELANLPLALAWCVLAGSFMLLLFTLLQLVATSQRGGNLLGNLVLFPLIMLGGSFFPFETMPDWMATLGRLTPNGWALEQLRRILWASEEPRSLAATALGAVVFGSVLFGGAVLRLRRFARG